MRGWTCKDRDGLSEHEFKEKARTVSGGWSLGTANRAEAILTGSEAMMRSVLGDDWTDFCERALGLDGKHLLVVILTVSCALACCGLYTMVRCIRATSHRWHQRPLGLSPELVRAVKSRAVSAKAQTVTGMGQLKPIRVAANEEEQQGLNVDADHA